MKAVAASLQRRRLALVADDLTGALDAAAPFAQDRAPVAVSFDGAAAPATCSAIAIDAGTRGASPAAAEAAARRIGPELRGAGIAFRKVDSMLRGHVAMEIAATAQAGGFASVVIAPAFPGQGRIMLQGRQYIRHADGGWRPVACDLMTELGALGLAPQSAIAGQLAGAGVFVCDAEFDTELLAIAAARPRLKPPILWCGTSGLARALVGRAVRPVVVPYGPMLGIVGSTHPVTMIEIDALEAAHPSAVLRIVSPDGIDGAVARADEALSRGASALIALALPPQPPRAALDILARLAAAARRLTPASLFATGGDTHAALARASRAAHLAVTGEAMPGLPLSRMVGGAWDGLPVLSKSGAFDGADILTTLFTSTKERSRARA